jgi:hypothetical protein
MSVYLSHINKNLGMYLDLACTLRELKKELAELAG